MPIYEYICPTCGVFEEMRKVSDPSLTVCPRGHAGVQRKMSASGFILKGSGWYVTDYAGKTTKSEKSESESASDTKSDKAEKKTKESSPAKKTSDKPSSSNA